MTRAIDEAERRGYRQRAYALLLEFELLVQERLRLTLLLQAEY